MDKDKKRRTEHNANVTKLANTYARSFNTAAESMGLNLPMPAIGKLIELFHDAIYTGEALQRDYGFPA